jgi:hypothetical protein
MTPSTRGNRDSVVVGSGSGGGSRGAPQGDRPIGGGVRFCRVRRESWRSAGRDRLTEAGRNTRPILVSRRSGVLSWRACPSIDGW